MAEYIDRELLLNQLNMMADGIENNHMAFSSKCAAGLLREIAQRLQSWPPKSANEWISVEDAMPKEDENVIVLTDDFLVWGARYHKGSFYLDGQCWTETVTHWMKPPTLPKEAVDRLKEKQRMESGIDPDTGEINEWWWRTPAR